MLTLYLLALVCGVVYWLLTRNHDYWEKQGIPYMKPRFLVGSIAKPCLRQQSLGEFLLEVYRSFPNEPAVGVFLTFEPCLVVRDFNIAKLILNSDNEYFGSRIFQLDPKREPCMANSVVAVPPKLWKGVRDSNTPAFTPARIKYALQYMGPVLKDLETRVKKSKVHNARELSYCLAVDFLSRAVMGLQGQALLDPNDTMLTVSNEMFSTDLMYAMSKFMMFATPGLFKMFRMQFFSDRVYNSVRQMMNSVVEAREKDPSARKDLITYLMNLRSKTITLDDGEEFSFKGDNMVAQLFIMLVAGFDTTSAGMTFCLYELAKDQECQDRLREAVKNLRPTDKYCYDYDEINSIKYLDMVIMEALRMHPSFPMTDRTCTKDYNVPGTKHTIKKGTKCFITMWGLQMDERYWENPEKFDPERFRDMEAVAGKPWFPFGDGARVCIGRRVATLEMKLLLVTLARQYRWRLHSSIPADIKLDPGTYTNQPLRPLLIEFDNLLSQ